MCMLFVKPENFTLPRNYFDSLKKKNSDGLAFYNKTDQTVFKTLNYEDGWKYLNDHHKDEIVVHFRFGTSGKNTVDQLHAFSICNDEYLLFHNGVLSTIDGDFKSGLSDTQVLVNIFRDEPVERLISYLEQHEKGSRFLIVEKSTNTYILPKCAKWVGDATIDGAHIIFSNSYAIDYKLLDNYKKFPPVNNYGITNLYPKSGGYYRDQDYYDSLFDDIDPNDIDDRFVDDKIVSDEIEELTIELLDCMWTQNRKAAIDFIKLYPDVAYQFMMDLMNKEELLPF